MKQCCLRKPLPLRSTRRRRVPHQLGNLRRKPRQPRRSSAGETSATVASIELRIALRFAIERGLPLRDRAPLQLTTGRPC